MSVPELEKGVTGKAPQRVAGYGAQPGVGEGHEQGLSERDDLGAFFTKLADHPYRQYAPLLKRYRM